MDEYQTFEWIRKVMRSCTTHLQLNSTSRLIERFKILFPDEYHLESDLYDYKVVLRPIIDLIIK